MRKTTATYIALLASAALSVGAFPASAGGWGHGPSFSQAGRFAHDTFHQVIVPTVLGTLNTLSGGAAHAGKGGGGEMDNDDDPPAAPPQAEKQPLADETPVQDKAEDKDNPLLPPNYFRDHSLLNDLKNMKDMPASKPEGPIIERRQDPIVSPCGMSCPSPLDNPAGDLPDPREEKSAEPPPVQQPILD